MKCKKNIFSKNMKIFVSVCLVFVSILGNIPITSMSVQAADEKELVEDTTYTDSEGITYSYKAYTNGTANIYSVENITTGCNINVPNSINGYNVTDISFSVTSKKLNTVTIPSNIENFGAFNFFIDEIQTLNYNAVNANGYSDLASKSFANCKVSKINFGNEVKHINKNVFQYVTFLEDTVTLDFDSIGVEAFRYAKFNNLVIKKNTNISADAFEYMTASSVTFEGEGIDLNINAFNHSKIGSVVINGNITSPVTTSLDSSFYFSTVGDISIGTAVTKIPDFLFYATEFDANELDFSNVTYIGKNSFYGTMYRQNTIKDVIIGENTTFIGRYTFRYCDMNNVTVNACEASSDFLNQSLTTSYLPVVDKIQIHKNSDYYNYFTNNNTNEEITSLCTNYSTTYGEKKYDSATNTFAVPKYETCDDCGDVITTYTNTAAYTVNFFNGTTNLSTQHVESGTDAVAPANPEKEGYTFTGWDKDYDNITEDCDIYAVFKINKYTVNFYDGDSLLSSQQIEYGADALAPATPTRPTEDWGVWEFVKWNGTYTNIKSNKNITAEFKKILNSYEVEFYDADGSLWDEQSVTHGSSALSPSNHPKKSSDEKFDYTFAEWDKAYNNVTGNLKIYPVYEQHIHTYDVNFYSNDLLSSQQIEYGEDALAPETPTLPEEEWGVWKFVGWVGDFLNVVENLDIFASWEQDFNEYTVVFKDADGNNISSQEVTYGDFATPPMDNPQKSSDEKFDYTFTGWDKDYDYITESITIKPVYSKTLRIFCAQFQDEFGNPYTTQYVRYGSAAYNLPAPIKEPTSQYEYTFSHWDKDITNVTSDIVVKPVYSQKLRSYTVKFYDANDKIINTQSVLYGGSAIMPLSVPTKNSTKKFDYTFKEWDKVYNNITENLEIKPLYEPSIRSYTVKFYNGDSLLSTQDVLYGTDAILPEQPVRSDESWGVWKFTKWNGNYKNVEQNEVAQAEFTKKLNTYQVVFKDEDKTIYSKQEVEYGTGAVAPANPEKEGYTFTGWDKAYTKVTEDMIILAMFEKNAPNIEENNAPNIEENNAPKPLHQTPEILEENNTPKTGDDCNILLYILLIIFSVIGLSISFRFSRKRK